MLTLSFVARLQGHERLNAHGHTFVLTDRWTYSAAVLLTNYLETRTAALVVGESPGARPNHPGDADEFTLPRTGINVDVSRLLHESTVPFDTRARIVPDVPVDLTWSDRVAGRDRILNAALEYDDEPPPPATMREAAIEGRYRLSPSRDAVVSWTEEGYRLMISGLVDSPLRHGADGWMTCDVRGLRIKSESDGGLLLRPPGGAPMTIHRAPHGEIPPVELLGLGRTFEAVKGYVALQDSAPDLMDLRDNNLAAEAVFHFCVTGDLEATRSILGVAIALNPESDFAKECLSFF